MRYAIYYSPSENAPLTQAAARWLGRDAFKNRDIEMPADSGLTDDEWRTLITEPRRYGFHATLKAPFALAAGMNEADLMGELDRFARGSAAFDLPELVVANLGPFFAIVPGSANSILQTFAAEVVQHFEPFRAPLTEADIARRNPERLGEAQRRYLMQYGYPYVREEFRFHMTLTGPVAEDRRDTIRQILERRFQPLAAQPHCLDALTLFVEPQRGQPFSVLHRAQLTGAGAGLTANGEVSA